MPNRHATAARRTDELQQRAFQTAGADPMGVRVVRGQRTYALAGFGFSRVVTGDEADEALPAANIPNIRTASIKDRIFDLGQFSAAAFYLEFLDNLGAVVALDNASVATVQAWRRQDNGDMVRGQVFSDVPHRVEQLDEGVVGRAVFYRLIDFTLAGGAVAVRLRVAGEGLGLAD